MFIQVVRGKTSDAAAVRAAAERWQTELRPGAAGYLGSTAGVADDGTAIAIVRFESEAAARANSDRPEQGAWAGEMFALHDGEPTFYDCPEVTTFLRGGSDAAGFVQVMIYRPKDVAAVRAMAGEFEKLAPTRPDILGGTTAYATDGTVIDTNYYTSEAEARAGEKATMPPEFEKLMQSFGENAGEITFVDLTNFWVH